MAGCASNRDDLCAIRRTMLRCQTAASRASVVASGATTTKTKRNASRKRGLTTPESTPVFNLEQSATGTDGGSLSKGNEPSPLSTSTLYSSRVSLRSAIVTYCYSDKRRHFRRSTLAPSRSMAHIDGFQRAFKAERRGTYTCSQRDPISRNPNHQRKTTASCSRPKLKTLTVKVFSYS